MGGGLNKRSTKTRFLDDAEAMPVQPLWSAQKGKAVIPNPNVQRH